MLMLSSPNTESLIGILHTDYNDKSVRDEMLQKYLQYQIRQEKDER